MEAEALNIAAVAVGAVAAFVLGMVLYHPKTFGTVWAKGSGVDLTMAPNPLAFVSQIAGLVALALVIGLTAQVSALWTALLAIVAAALFVVSAGVFSGKSGGAIAVDGGYIIGAGILMIAAQGIL